MQKITIIIVIVIILIVVFILIPSTAQYEGPSSTEGSAVDPAEPARKRKSSINTDLTNPILADSQTEIPAESTSPTDGSAEGADGSPQNLKEGDTCGQNEECEGYEKGTAGTLACCNNVCTAMLENYKGVGWCPDKCNDSPWQLWGTCGRGNEWPRKEGQQCDLHTDCDGHKPGADSLACQDKKCIPQIKDYLGNYAIPKDCKDGPWAAPGTCGNLVEHGGYLHWPRKNEEHCYINEDCDDFAPGQDTLACQINPGDHDKNKCVQQVKDYINVFYLPNEARDGPWSSAGTGQNLVQNPDFPGKVPIHWPREKDESCKINEDCRGFAPGQDTLACESGTCVQQIKDHIGVYYLPSQAKDGPWSGPGTGKNLVQNPDFTGKVPIHWPREKDEHCYLNEDCNGFIPGQNTLACITDRQDSRFNKCGPQIQDYIGTYYLPDEARDGPWSGAGTGKNLVQNKGKCAECNGTIHWPREKDESCKINEDCKGFIPGQDTLACGNGKCVNQIQDYIGTYYLPDEARDGPWSGAGTGKNLVQNKDKCAECNGTINWPRKAGEECKINQDCDGHWPGQDTLGCDKNVCVQQKKDWFGVYYNPSECVGKAFGAPGTC